VIVFLNPRASYGRAAAKWKRVRPELERRVGRFEVVEIGAPDAVSAAVSAAAARGERVFVAAGGDGTVNLVANAVLGATDMPGERLRLGAVGLGSSNDFHKPFRRDAFIRGVPARVDCGRTEARDVLRVDLAGADGRRAPRHAVNNASIGVAAEANASFNDPTPFVRAVRRVSVDAAIVASVMRTLARRRDIQCRIAVDGSDAGSFRVSSLGFVKNPHFAGAFCYDTPVAPDDGRMSVHLCEGLTRLEVLTTLAALSRRRFAGRPKTRTWVGRRALVEADVDFALEMDGEVVYARRVEFSVVPRALLVCR